MYIPKSAHPPVSARAKVPGSGATLAPGFDVLVPFPKMNWWTYKSLPECGLTLTLIGEVELLM
jgi:hypothetical protein